MISSWYHSVLKTQIQNYNAACGWLIWYMIRCSSTAISRRIVDSRGRNFPHGVFLPRSELYAAPGVVWQLIWSRVRQISRVHVETWVLCSIHQLEFVNVGRVINRFSIWLFVWAVGVVWQSRVRQISRVQVEQRTQVSARWQKSHKQVLHLIVCMLHHMPIRNRVAFSFIRAF